MSDRKHKYRFYDNDDKKYYPVISLFFPLGSYSGKDIIIEPDDKQSTNWRSIEDGFLEQYTGIKKIFGGDVVGLYSYKYNKKTGKHDIKADLCSKGTVVFKRGCAGSQGYGQGRAAQNVYVYGWFVECEYTDDPLNESYEIIGTIHDKGIKELKE